MQNSDECRGEDEFEICFKGQVESGKFWVSSHIHQWNRGTPLTVWEMLMQRNKQLISCSLEEISAGTSNKTSFYFLYLQARLQYKNVFKSLFSTSWTKLGNAL